MPRYVINRKFEVGEDDMPEVGRRSRRIIEEEFGNVVWIHSHVAVENDGPPLSAETLAHLGERFHRPAGQVETGSGLGVSIAPKSWLSSTRASKPCR